MARATVADIVARRLGQGEVEIEGVGSVLVRALSREELLTAGEDADGNKLGIVPMERKMVALGMVDPAMTEADVAVWQANSPADELSVVVDKINKLSGVAQGSTKEAFPGV
jgi:hypothetical protein